MWLDMMKTLSLRTVTLRGKGQLRTALHFLGGHRVIDGTPSDNQLGAYLLDVDLML